RATTPDSLRFAHFHFPKCAISLSALAGQILVRKNFDSRGRPFGWADEPNIVLDDFAFAVVLKINVHAESDHAAAQTRSDVLSFAQAGDAGSSGKTCVRSRAESARQQA